MRSPRLVLVELVRHVADREAAFAGARGHDPVVVGGDEDVREVAARVGVDALPHHAENVLGHQFLKTALRLVVAGPHELVEEQQQGVFDAAVEAADELRRARRVAAVAAANDRFEDAVYEALAGAFGAPQHERPSDLLPGPLHEGGHPAHHRGELAGVAAADAPADVVDELGRRR